MNDDCDGELVVLAETVATYSQETSAKHLGGYAANGMAGDHKVEDTTTGTASAGEDTFGHTGSTMLDAAADTAARTMMDAAADLVARRAAARGRTAMHMVITKGRAATAAAAAHRDVAAGMRSMIDAAADILLARGDKPASASAPLGDDAVGKQTDDGAPLARGSAANIPFASSAPSPAKLARGTGAHAPLARPEAKPAKPAEAAGVPARRGRFEAKPATAWELDAGSDSELELPAISRKQVKPRVRTKRNRPRSKTIALKRLTRAELQRGALANPPVDDAQRPQTRAECRDAPRPCPWVACKHHLYLDINPRTGSIKINFPDLEPWELQHTCALDVADNGGLTLEEIGLITNLTRERVRQVEVRGLLTLRTRSNSLK